MGYTINVVDPTPQDERYHFKVVDPKDPMSDYYTVAFARAGDGGFEFWPGFGGHDFPLPHKGHYDDIDDIVEEMAHLIDTQTPEDRAWRVLSRLAGELSPENLSCDGELRGAKLAAKKKRLDREWAAQEGILGRRVTEDEVWKRTCSLA